eukprot:6177447-Pleurochrysis_carterae.AAC.6
MAKQRAARKLARCFNNQAPSCAAATAPPRRGVAAAAAALTQRCGELPCPTACMYPASLARRGGGPLR